MGHSSVVISSISDYGVKRHHLLILGGCKIDTSTVSNCWVMDIENNEWQKVILLM